MRGLKKTESQQTKVNDSQRSRESIRLKIAKHEVVLKFKTTSNYKEESRLRGIALMREQVNDFLWKSSTSSASMSTISCGNPRQIIKRRFHFMETTATKKRKIRWKKYIPFYIMMAPALIYVFINNYIPMAGIVVAFKDYKVKKGIFGSDWCGFKNFEFLFKTNDAWNITRNTILYNLAFIVLGTVFAIAVAIIFNEIQNKAAQKFYQTAILLPYLISIIVVAYLVYAFLSVNTGFINKSIIEPLGGTGVSWYDSPKYWPFILVFVNLWKGFGYNTIIYLANIVGIDRSYYEAAVVDGASKMGADSVYHTAMLKEYNYHIDAHVRGPYILFRLWPVLSGAHELRAAH